MSEDLYAEWRDESACRNTIKKKPYMLGAWDGPNEDGVSHPYSEEAKNICVTKCKVRDKCLQSALNNPEAQGIRGGYEFDGGKLRVAAAREIRDTMDVVVSDRQSMGRPKKKKKPDEETSNDL